MSFKVMNLFDNDDVSVVAESGQFKVVEWARDLSTSPASAQAAWFASQMDVRRRQLVCTLDGRTGVTIQSGAMQWTVGDVEATSGIKGVGDLASKMFRGAISQDSAIKPEYTGNGLLVCEPTWRHIILVELEHWNGAVALDDGLFLACDSTLDQSLVRRKNLSSAVAGNEGLFNLCVSGKGVVALECPCPEEEFAYIDLYDDVLKVDGNYALAWTPSLDFTVERSGRSLAGSAVSGEGLVNVYRGTGRVMLAPMQAATRHQTNASNPTDGASLGAMLSGFAGR